jgi:ferredoxin
MFHVKEDLCAGCGLCVESCPRWAISVESGQARINQARCNGCGTCLNVCPQGAIVELVPTSKDELKTTISSLKHRANELAERIESLRRTGKVKV